MPQFLLGGARSINVHCAFIATVCCNMLSLEIDGADVWNIYADALDAAHSLFVSLDTTARLNRVELARTQRPIVCGVDALRLYCAFTFQSLLLLKQRLLVFESVPCCQLACWGDSKRISAKFAFYKVVLSTDSCSTVNHAENWRWWRWKFDWISLTRRLCA